MLAPLENWQRRELTKAEDDDEEEELQGEEVVWMLDGAGGCVCSPDPFIAEQVRCRMIVYCESSTGAINQGSDLHWEFEMVRKGTEALSFWPVFTSVLVMRF